MKKIVSLMLVCTLFVSMCFFSFADSGAKETNVSVLYEKYSDYDLSTLETASKIFFNDVSMQELAKEYTPEKINNILDKALEISKDKDNKRSQEIKQYLENLKELHAIDKNYKIITTTKAENQKLSGGYVTQAVSSFDLRGTCIKNAKLMSSTYSTNYKLGLIMYNNNIISASAYAYMSTGIFFTSKVKSGGEWDFKATLGYSTLYKVTYEGYTFYYSGEIIGNFHYGYTGATVFPDTVLLSAAGLVQIISGTSDISFWDSYFDDPMDQTWIEEGIRVYKAGDI